MRGSMKIWTVGLAVGFAGLAIAGSAEAADLVRPIVKAAPAPLQWDWTGTYIGLQGGGAWGKANHTDAAPFNSGDYNVSGGLVGVTWGYNWQVGNTVIGFEGDASWADIRGSTTGINGLTARAAAPPRTATPNCNISPPAACASATPWDAGCPT